MLGKLLKYEWKATGRGILPIYGALLIFALMTRLLMFADSRTGSALSHSLLGGLLAGIVMLCYGFLVVAVCVITVVILVQRFYKNLLGDEGYLMHTLPVKPWMNLTAKTITAMIWCVLSGCMSIFSVMVMAITPRDIVQFFPTLGEFLSEFTQHFGAQGWLLGLEGGIMLLIILAAYILAAYTAMVLGHMFGSHKVFWSILIYAAICTLANVATVPYYRLLDGISSFFTLPTDPIPLAYLAMFTLLLFFLIQAVIYFAVASWGLTRRLNLE